MKRWTIVACALLAVTCLGRKSPGRREEAGLVQLLPRDGVGGEGYQQMLAKNVDIAAVENDGEGSATADLVLTRAKRGRSAQKA